MKRILSLLVILLLLGSNFALAQDNSTSCTGFWGSVSCFLFGSAEKRAAIGGKAWWDFEGGNIAGEAIKEGAALVYVSPDLKTTQQVYVKSGKFYTDPDFKNLYVPPTKVVRISETTPGSAGVRTVFVAPDGTATEVKEVGSVGGQPVYQGTSGTGYYTPTAPIASGQYVATNGNVVILSDGVVTSELVPVANPNLKTKSVGPVYIKKAPGQDLQDLVTLSATGVPQGNNFVDSAGQPVYVTKKGYVLTEANRQKIIQYYRSIGVTDAVDELSTADIKSWQVISDLGEVSEENGELKFVPQGAPDQSFSLGAIDLSVSAVGLPEKKPLTYAPIPASEPAPKPVVEDWSGYKEMAGLPNRGVKIKDGQLVVDCGYFCIDDYPITINPSTGEAEYTDGSGSHVVTLSKLDYVQGTVDLLAEQKKVKAWLAAADTAETERLKAKTPGTAGLPEEERPKFKPLSGSLEKPASLPKAGSNPKFQQGFVDGSKADITVIQAMASQLQSRVDQGYVIDECTAGGCTLTRTTKGGETTTLNINYDSTTRAITTVAPSAPQLSPYSSSAIVLSKVSESGWSGKITDNGDILVSSPTGKELPYKRSYVAADGTQIYMYQEPGKAPEYYSADGQAYDAQGNKVPGSSSVLGKQVEINVLFEAPSSVVSTTVKKVTFSSASVGRDKDQVAFREVKDLSGNLVGYARYDDAAAQGASSGGGSASNIIYGANGNRIGYIDTVGKFVTGMPPGGWGTAPETVVVVSEKGALLAGSSGTVIVPAVTQTPTPYELELTRNADAAKAAQEQASAAFTAAVNSIDLEAVNKKVKESKKATVVIDKKEVDLVFTDRDHATAGERNFYCDSGCGTSQAVWKEKKPWWQPDSTLDDSSGIQSAANAYQATLDTYTATAAFRTTTLASMEAYGAYIAVPGQQLVDPTTGRYAIKSDDGTIYGYVTPTINNVVYNKAGQPIGLYDNSDPKNPIFRLGKGAANLDVVDANGRYVQTKGAIRYEELGTGPSEKAPSVSPVSGTTSPVVAPVPGVQPSVAAVVPTTLTGKDAGEKTAVQLLTEKYGADNLPSVVTINGQLATLITKADGKKDYVDEGGNHVYVPSKGQYTIVPQKINEDFSMVIYRPKKVEGQSGIPDGDYVYDSATGTVTRCNNDACDNPTPVTGAAKDKVVALLQKEGAAPPGPAPAPEEPLPVAASPAPGAAPAPAGEKAPAAGQPELTEVTLDGGKSYTLGGKNVKVYRDDDGNIYLSTGEDNAPTKDPKLKYDPDEKKIVTTSDTLGLKDPAALDTVNKFTIGKGEKQVTYHFTTDEKTGESIVTQVVQVKEDPKCEKDCKMKEEEVSVDSFTAHSLLEQANEKGAKDVVVRVSHKDAEEALRSGQTNNAELYNILEKQRDKDQATYEAASKQYDALNQQYTSAKDEWEQLAQKAAQAQASEGAPALTDLEQKRLGELAEQVPELKKQAAAAQQQRDEAKANVDDAESKMKWRTAMTAFESVGAVSRELGKLGKYQGISNLLFPETTKEWNKWANNEFFNTWADIPGRVAREVCEYDQKKRAEKVGQSVSFIHTPSGAYQFIGSIQAEKTITNVPIMCEKNNSVNASEELICAKGMVCVNNFCYGGTDAEEIDPDIDTPAQAQLYKIRWGVASPADLAFTPFVDENGVSVKFNLRLYYGENPLAWVFKRVGTALDSVIELKNGAQDGGTIVKYLGTDYTRVCIEFNPDYRVKDDEGDYVDHICTNFMVINPGSVEYGGSGGAATSSTTSADPSVEFNI
jgi:hypothetical protein